MLLLELSEFQVNNEKHNQSSWYRDVEKSKKIWCIFILQNVLNTKYSVLCLKLIGSVPLNYIKINLY